MHPRRMFVPVAAALVAILFTQACGDGGTEPTPDPPRPTTVTVTPASAELAAFGATVQFAAEIHDQYGQVMAGVSVAWASSDASVTSVDASGLAAAVANGTATITATAGGVAGTAAVTVAQVVSAVTVAPDSATVVEGDTLRMTAAAADANGHAVAVEQFFWASSDTLVARVDESGLVTGLAEGEVAVTATTSGVSGGAELLVEPPVPTTIAVTPDTVRFTALGQAVELAAEVRDQIGRVMPEAVVSWASGDTLVTVVDSAGVVTGTRNGETTISATAGEAAGMAAVVVMQVAGTVVVSAPEPVVAIGDTLRLAAEAFDENGHGVEGAVFSWSSSDAGVARVDDWGLVEGVIEGTAIITATAGDALGTAEITVENPDRAVLQLFYHATDGPNWVNNENWMTDAPLGEWYGVATDSSGRVVRLNLGGKLETLGWTSHGLYGTIPPELGGLAKLTVLDLELNHLWGQIPPELGGLVGLHRLALSENSLEGEIPAELGGLRELARLELDDNQLTGPIPPELGNLTRLRMLTLYSNQITGPIPPDLGQLTELVYLNLAYNQLSGHIPRELGNLTRLTSLWTAANPDLTGPIPSELGNLADLRQLILNSSALTGSIPPELGRLTKLHTLGLAGNRLMGPIPHELGNLVNLTSLGLGDNLLTGSFPTSLLGLTALNDLGCAHTDGACLPATAEFREWVREIEARNAGDFPVDVPFCDEIDRQALETLYQTAGGSGWTLSSGWLNEEDLGQWQGVETDTIGRVSGLDLAGNGLAGRLPEALGQLADMTKLRVGNNALAGRLPMSLTSLALEELDYDDTSLCVPDNAGFAAWLNGIPDHTGTGVQCPPLTDREILELLYLNTDGPNWNESSGWLTEASLSAWHGVETDAAGRVVELRLVRNGLSGAIPPELGALSGLTGLDVAGNDLSGQIPPELGELTHLESLRLSGNRLSGGLPPALGGLSELTFLNVGVNELSGAIPPELGDLHSLRFLYLSNNRLSDEVPKELGNLEGLMRLSLASNLLSGSVPSTLGTLANLRSLDLSRNRLSGEIPEELVQLRGIETVSLADNNFVGRIPRQFGDLVDLSHLDLSDNELQGSIPPELGGLGNLATLNLGNNQLSGSLPPQLGRVTNLETLDLRSNALAGPIPPEFGDLARLQTLILARNPDLAGALPQDITALDRLGLLMAGETGLCLPADPGFDAWFGSIANRYLARCHEGPAVYLTQAVQSWGHPVPLLAGEVALLRVFVTAPQGSGATMPAVRATFWVDDIEAHSVDIPASSRAVPDTVAEGDLARSANATIPAEVVAPGLEVVIEVDPDGTLDPELGVTKRIPESGRLAVDVQAVPHFKLTLIPFLWEGEADSSVVESVDSIAADPDGHRLLIDTRRLLPIAGLSVTAHEPVLVSHPSPYRILAQVDAIRLMEDGSGHWMGLFTRRPGSRRAWPGGVGQLPGKASVSLPRPYFMAHELGHNLGLRHAPCGGAGGPDPWFPSPAGRIANWGYDFEKKALVRPNTPDIMSYCDNPHWTSAYHFNKSLQHRLTETGAATTALAREADRVRSLLVWGGLDSMGVPYLDPAFVVDATPALPAAGGEYAIEGATADGTSLFSFTFDMPLIGDAEGEETSFVFALPVQGGWADDLASITLSGPGGSAILDGTVDRPMAILRDAQTGQVRGFLSDLPTTTQPGTDPLQRAVAEGLEILLSRGIPGADAWRR